MVGVYAKLSIRLLIVHVVISAIPHDEERKDAGVVFLSRVDVNALTVV